ncbi:dihydrolipoamide acetyltransferase family protein [Brochothrix campestris]|uniref:Dihydrolipoamide acetyltransferase component of pyruvate dehydrogenase complex n=1 Tax=Brochothrix campestris FSL F6-1037 TaxID=1265861 RepID=W7D116_9LIST|nr:dihydrolipoamide acetyltransferase family protein [Brochothrix campestris]EUJ41686.1 hypothetical protein BCAMP_02325 [Brochothrix campestris FSL F6-1037]
MAIENITMPQLGESVTEGTLTAWLVQPGDQVNEYDPIAEVITDKVTAEIPSSFTGVIKDLVAAIDVAVPINEVICTIETAPTSNNAMMEKQPNVAEKQPNVAEKQPNVAEKQPNVAKINPLERGRYSPVVRRLAHERGLDLSHLSGTGKGGRITRKDVLTAPPQKEVAPASGAEATVAPRVAPTPPPTQVHTAAILSGDKTVPLTPVRKAIAKHMVESVQQIPHAWVMVEVDATALVVARNRLKDEFKAKEGFSLSYFAFFVKAVAQALKKYPELNSTWTDEAIIQRQAINLSIAVATDDALFVPVIQQADELSVKGIGKQINTLAQKVRTGKLSANEMTGGTFTVNSTGSFGSVQSMGIINHPQAAILQVESIVKRPVVKDGMIAIRDMVNLCLSIDHRVLDGLVAGRFLQEIKTSVETIDPLTTNVY